jgi:adenine deaminase
LKRDARLYGKPNKEEWMMKGLLTREDQQLLIEVAMGNKPPTLVIRGGQVLNVFTGRLERKDVALAGKRIAWVGEYSQSGLLADGDVPVLDAEGMILVPGYIEPHSHPFQLYNPLTLAEKVGSLGTTTLVHDNLFFFTAMELDDCLGLIEALDHSPVKHFWWARWDAQTLLSGGNERLFDVDRVRKMMSHPRVVQAGELTDWLPLLNGDLSMTEWVLETRNRGIRVEGHAPGASFRTLSRLAAAGVTGDHESITAEEVWRRLELGFWVTLRHSSIRPDLPVLLEGLMKTEKVPWHRIMLTTDGPTPIYLKRGFTDYMLRTAMECGLDPVTAYQMVTINPAIYYRMDEHVGAIAPGRIADINLLGSLDDPTPAMVIADGELLAECGRLVKKLTAADIHGRLSWKDSGQVRFEPGDFEWSGSFRKEFPVMNLINPVITRLTIEETGGPADWSREDGRLLACLVDRGGEWITYGVLRGFASGIDGLASSYTGSNDLLVIGRDSGAMAEAANRVVEGKGGIAWIQDGRLEFWLPLPLLGCMSTEPVDDLIGRLEPFVERLRSFGHPFDDPVYTLLFLSSTHLPQIRLTRDGLFRVKDKAILVPANKRQA